jgi:hypothetical protein
MVICFKGYMSWISFSHGSKGNIIEDKFYSG